MARPEDGEEPPPFRGWDGDADPRASWSGSVPPPRGGMPDISPLLEVLAALQRAVPAELRDQFASLQRELLLTLRAFIDWYLERLDARDHAPQIEDIPID